MKKRIFSFIFSIIFIFTISNYSEAASAGIQCDGTVSVNFRGAYWTQECSLEEFYLLYEGAVLFESYKECIYQQELYELEAVQAVLGD